MNLTEKSKDMKGRPNRYFRFNADAVRKTLREIDKDLKWLEGYLSTTQHTVSRIINQERVPGPELMSKLMSLTGLPESELLIPLGAVYA